MANQWIRITCLLSHKNPHTQSLTLLISIFWNINLCHWDYRRYRYDLKNDLRHWRSHDAIDDIISTVIKMIQNKNKKSQMLQQIKWRSKLYWYGTRFFFFFSLQFRTFVLPISRVDDLGPLAISCHLKQPTFNIQIQNYYAYEQVHFTWIFNKKKGDVHRRWRLSSRSTTSTTTKEARNNNG